MKILFPLDGSRFGEAVIPKALEFVGDREAEVVLLHVMTEFKDAFPFRAPRPERSPAEEALGIDSQGYLTEVARQYFPDGAHTRIVESSDAARGIISFAKGEGVGLIVMSTHGRTGLGTILLGSVASAVLRSRAAPVLLWRPDLPDDV